MEASLSLLQLPPYCMHASWSVHTAPRQNNSDVYMPSVLPSFFFLLVHLFTPFSLLSISTGTAFYRRRRRPLLSLSFFLLAFARHSPRLHLLLFFYLSFEKRNELRNLLTGLRSLEPSYSFCPSLLLCLLRHVSLSSSYVRVVRLFLRSSFFFFF